MKIACYGVHDESTFEYCPYCGKHIKHKGEKPSVSPKKGGILIYAYCSVKECEDRKSIEIPKSTLLLGGENGGNINDKDIRNKLIKTNG